MGELARTQLLVLVGPRGSGKSTLGRMLEQRLGARFVNVERIAARVLAECGGVIDARYMRRALRAILDELARYADCELLVIESTGASGESDVFFSVLRERYEVLFVRVHAERETCDARILEREPGALPDERLGRLYELSSRLSLPWDLELDNDLGMDARSLADAVRPLLRD